MKKTTLYTCEICNKEFSSKIKAKKHEEWHNICRCQGGGSPRKYYNREIVGYGKSESIYVDFKIPAIVKLHNYDDNTYIYPKDRILIKFCPYCGRNLAEEE